MCGASGCWESYISNLATLSRYFGWDLSKLSPNKLHDAKQGSFTVLDLITRARAGDAKAMAAVQSTARFLGLGLATVVNVINPECIYLERRNHDGLGLDRNDGDSCLGERALTERGGRRRCAFASTQEYPRLREQQALIAAPTFAAPRVA